MENIKYINKDLAIAVSQPSVADLQQAAAA
jgi:hypothetical protein